MPKVSVVIPAYNAMVYLPKTVASVLNQTFTDFEVLIVNDGSSDHILEWATSVIDPRVKIISQENQGLPGARNTGIENAQGEYIALVDADDLWEPTKLEKQVNCLDGQPIVGLVYTWTVLIDENDNPTGRIFASHFEGNVWAKLLETNEMNNCSSSIIRRCCFDKVGLFDRSLKSAEDMDMWLRIAANYQFAVVKEPLTFYRQHCNSMSTNRPRVIQSMRTVIEKTFQSVPFELLYLRNRAYSYINMCSAWLAIEQKDYKQAIYFRHQAMLHNFQICYSQNFIRLSLAILLIRWMSPNGYNEVRNIARFLRCKVFLSAR
ncbi:glycosyltransferase family 2 protein [Anabaena minutissima FACHB-250]|nr:glycosyltransferase family 2 protein [Anabaena minutissima FACHB-250]